MVSCFANYKSPHHTIILQCHFNLLFRGKSHQVTFSWVDKSWTHRLNTLITPPSLFMLTIYSFLNVQFTNCFTKPFLGNYRRDSIIIHCFCFSSNILVNYWSVLTYCALLSLCWIINKFTFLVSWDKHFGLHTATK